MDRDVAERYFNKVDRNNDGMLTASEFEGSDLSKIVVSFQSLHPNKVGVVEKAEFINMFVASHAPVGKDI